MFCGMSASWPDEEDDYFESLESFRLSSASLTLHESQSCSCLLPCGLLPEELAELEDGATAASINVEAAMSHISLNDDSEPAAPCTPQGCGVTPALACRLLTSSKDVPSCQEAAGVVVEDAIASSASPMDVCDVAPAELAVELAKQVAAAAVAAALAAAEAAEPASDCLAGSLVVPAIS